MQTRVWRGEVLAVQPRIRLRRIGDEDQHSYQGFVLHLLGTVGKEQRTFSVGVGKAAQKKHAFRAGDIASGQGVPVADPSREVAELYKASKLAVESRSEAGASDCPPWTGAPPELPEYRAQGHRTLPPDAFKGDCGRCLWGCRMPLDGDAEGMSLECYGPEDCSLFPG